MISLELARRFIERVTKYTEYNVNIMDENGVIIASRDPERVGQYHVVAHQLILGKADLIEAETDTPHNIRQGVNMVIEVDGKREGVVGVTGVPSEIRAAAMMTKMAIETMVRYERQQEERRRRENRKEQFIYLLTQVEDASHEELRTLAADLGFPEEMVRIPILLRTRGADTEELLIRFRESRLHTPLDFSIAPDAQHVLVFKTIPEREGNLLTYYKSFILEYLSPIRQDMEKAGWNACFYIGSFQENYKQYFHAYRHCKWLERHVSEAEAERTGRVVFFYEHLHDYTQYILPMQELRSMFHICETRIPEKMKEMLVKTVLTLSRNNFNYVSAAKELYIHKNTLAYRLNQIRDITMLDPVGRAQDRALLVSFAVYLNRTNKYE